MSDFALFMKQNKIQRENMLYPATKSLKDEKGNPLMWEFKPVSTRESEAIQLECCTQKGDKFSFNYPLYINKLICASVVMPNLNDKNLQDSYGCFSPEELIREMINSPGEYSAVSDFVQELCGFNETFGDKIKIAKN